MRRLRALALAFRASGRYLAGRISEEEYKAQFNEARAMLGLRPLP